MIQETKKLPQLIKGQSTYKLVVPENVEEKIRYLLRKFPSTEWSGVLFYTHEGTFEEDNLVVTCQDIYPMDLGNATYTEFAMSEDVAAYMADNIELFDYDMGLIHSHHNMSAFFSGTDTSTLQAEGNERNCFVSLIVNNTGEYCAAITRKVQSKSEVTIKKLGQSYQFFGEGEKRLSDENVETTKVVESEVIEYYMMDVERHEVHNSLAYLDERFKEIEEKKRQATTYSNSTMSWLDKYRAPVERTPYQPIDTWNNSWDSDNEDVIPKSKWQYEPQEKEPTLWPDEEMGKKSVREVKFEDDFDYTPDPDMIHACVVHMLTCSLLLNPDKCDIKQWVHKHMVKMYDKMFPEDTSYAYSSFDVYCDFIVEYMVRYFYDLNIPADLDADIVASRVASAMLEELDELQDDNVYLDKYKSTLESYIYE